MRLSLSSAAAPGATQAELLAACARRGLAALELVEGDDHGAAVGMDAVRAEAVREAAREAEVAICGLLRDGLEAWELDSAARTAAALQAPLVVPLRAIDRGVLDRAAPAFRAAGARLLLAHGSEPAAVDSLRRYLASLPDRQAIGFAWEHRPESDDPASIGEVLTAVGADLGYVRLHGGGPESMRQTGRGMGALMARLALARYAGPLVITPSDRRYHHVWSAWLGRGGGWGCGSKASAGSPSLELETLTAINYR